MSGSNPLHGLSAIAAEMPQLRTTAEQRQHHQTRRSSSSSSSSSLPLRKRWSSFGLDPDPDDGAGAPPDARPSVGAAVPAPSALGLEGARELERCILRNELERTLLRSELERRRSSLSLAYERSPSHGQVSSNGPYGQSSDLEGIYEYSPRSSIDYGDGPYAASSTSSASGQLVCAPRSYPRSQIDPSPALVGPTSGLASSAELFALARRAEARERQQRLELEQQRQLQLHQEREKRLLQDRIYQEWMLEGQVQQMRREQARLAAAVPSTVLHQVLSGGLAIEGAMADSQRSVAKVKREAEEQEALQLCEEIPQAEEESASTPGIGTLSLPNDSTFLPEMHCFLRSVCLEMFISTEEHAHNPGKGVRPARVGVVGFRCMHCRHRPRYEQANQAICYPSGRDKIYESVRNFQRVHLMACQDTPGDVKSRFKGVVKRAAGPRRSQRLVRAYYAQAASEVGLVDSEANGGGLEYKPENRRDSPSEEMMAIIRAAQEEEELSAREAPTPTLVASSPEPVADGDSQPRYGKFESVASDGTRRVLQLCKEAGTPFVRPEDFDDVSDQVYLLFHQLVPCKHTYATIKRRKLDPEKARKVPGLCCRHCAHEGGPSGMYFPLGVDSLGDSSFSQTLMMHLSGCPHVPEDVKGALGELKALAREYNSSVKRGSKKVFIKRVWGRMEEIARSGDYGGGIY